MARAIGTAGVKITNLRAFQQAIRRANATAARELSKALKGVGTRRLLPRVRMVAAHRTGALAAAYKISARSASAAITNSLAYAAGAEWGLHGKWTGFREAYRPAPGDQRGRFAWRVVREQEEELAVDVFDALESFVTIGGWAHP